MYGGDSEDRAADTQKPGQWQLLSIWARLPAGGREAHCPQAPQRGKQRHTLSTEPPLLAPDSEWLLRLSASCACAGAGVVASDPNPPQL